jgi:hypothetical protein
MKKKINIVLIVVVLGLWGTVGYKAINNYFFSEKLAIKTIDFNSALNVAQINKDTFHMVSIMRDPFLNKQECVYDPVSVTRMSDSRPSKIKKNIAAPILKSRQEYINWPSIYYYGYIKSKVKNEELILVKINEIMYKLRINEQVEGVTLMKVYKDSIEFNFNRTRKIIQKMATK